MVSSSTTGTRPCSATRASTETSRRFCLRALRLPTWHAARSAGSDVHRFQRLGPQVSCNDGTVIHVDGFCYMNCVPGTITSNTITLPHEALAHGQNTTVECPIDAWSGSMRKPETTVLALWFPLVSSTQPHRAGVTEQNATTETSKKGCFISRERAP